MAGKPLKSKAILCFISLGAAAWAALQIARRSENDVKQIVVMLPDRVRGI